MSIDKTEILRILENRKIDNTAAVMDEIENVCGSFPNHPLEENVQTALENLAISNKMAEEQKQHLFK